MKKQGSVILTEARYAELRMAEEYLKDLEGMIKSVGIALGDVYLSSAREEGRRDFHDGIRMLIRALHSAVAKGDPYPLRSLTDDFDDMPVERNIVVCCGKCGKVFSDKQSVDEYGKWAYTCPQCGKEIEPWKKP